MTIKLSKETSREMVRLLYLWIDDLQFSQVYEQAGDSTNESTEVGVQASSDDDGDMSTS